MGEIEMKRAVITILGTIGVPREGQERAEYFLSDSLQEDFSLKRDRYTNMLPLLIDNLKDSYGTIECIYTEDAEKSQSKVLEYENLEFNIKDNGFYISNTDGEPEAGYSFFLEKYNEVIEKYDRVIIDVSHGFRHLPILATVDMIMQNIKDPKKIEYIFFAKEIEKFSKYEVVDLKEYLELANLSFMLSSFNQNYTVSSNIRFKNQLYKKIAKELSDFSHHFLSNSLKPLIEGKLIENIIDNLDELKKEKSIENFKHYIDEIIEHLEDIRQLKHENEWGKLYELSKIMDKRGYQLNAITLLFEAVGFYCLDSLSHIKVVKNRAKVYKGYIEEQKKPLYIYSTYTMTNQSRVIVKIKDRFKVDNNDLFIDAHMKDTIVEYLKSVNGLDSFKNFIETLEGLRNNLAHGNTSFTLKDVKKIYKINLKKFKKFVIDEDILQGTKLFDKKSTVDRLNDKWQ